MRKSVIGVLAIAALAASSVVAVARDGHGGGGGGGGGGGAAPSFSGGAGGNGGSGGGPGPSFSRGGSVQSFGRTAAPGSMSAPNVSRPGYAVTPRRGNVAWGNSGPKNSGVYHDKHGHRHHRRAFAFVPFGFYGGDYDAYTYDDDCYQVRRVRTPYGWRLRRVYVCDYPYY
jgi:hypothetical protein